VVGYLAMKNRALSTLLLLAVFGAAIAFSLGGCENKAGAPAASPADASGASAPASSAAPAQKPAGGGGGW
jgi:hypothetical protein